MADRRTFIWLLAGITHRPSNPSVKMMTTETFHQEEVEEIDELETPRLSELQQRLQEMDQRTREFVVEHPFMAVGIAVGVGYMIGRIVSRW